MTWSNLSSEALFASLPDPAIVFSVAGQVVAANQCAAELFEQTMPFPQISVTELLAQPERSRLDPLTWMQKWADTPNAPELEYVYLICRTASGAEKQLSVRVARLVPSEVETYFLVTMHDVSRREERMRKERDAHRLANQVLAITADAVIMADEDANVTYANASADALLEYLPGTLKNQNLGELLPHRFRTSHIQHMREFAAEVSPARLMGERKPIVALSKNGEEIPVEASISRVTIQGKPIFVALLRDLRQRASE